MSRAGEATSCEFQKTAGNKARSALPVRYHFNNYGTRGRMGARRVVPVRVCASRASGDGGGERNGSGRATAFQKSIRVTFIPENGFGRAGVDSEPERGGPPSVGKPGDLQLGFAIGAGVLEPREAVGSPTVPQTFTFRPSAHSRGSVYICLFQSRNKINLLFLNVITRYSGSSPFASGCRFRFVLV